MKKFNRVVLVTAGCLMSLQAQGKAADRVIPTPGKGIGDFPLLFEGDEPPQWDSIVSGVWKKSREVRDANLAKIAGNERGLFPLPGAAGDAAWAMVAMNENVRLDEANRLLRRAVDGADPGVKDGEKFDLFGDLPLVRSLIHFGAQGGRAPGRMDAQTESAIKEYLFRYLQAYLDPAKRLAWAAINGQVPLDSSYAWGTENHTITRKSVVYHSLGVLKADAAFKDRVIAERSVAEWYAVMNDHMKEWMKEHVLQGLWTEVGASAYQKYSYAALLNLADLSEDPLVRQRAKIFLDISLIEEEQISVLGLRGGGRCRAHVEQDLQRYKNALYGDNLRGISMAPSRDGILEMSRYQVPAIAIVLRESSGPVKPFHIINRVPGEIKNEPSEGNAVRSERTKYLKESAQVNYAYRTPNYLLGSMLFDPNRTYAPISESGRWCGLLFQSGEWIYPAPEVIKGRPGKVFRSVQQDNILLVQKRAGVKTVKTLRVAFSSGTALSEKEGWIFAQSGDGYAAVRFISPEERGKSVTYQLVTVGKEILAVPSEDYLPIILHAGDVHQYGSFEKFQNVILSGKIVMSKNDKTLEYRPADGMVLVWGYDQDAEPLPSPEINGQTPELLPGMTFNSPFLKAGWMDLKIYAGAGPYRAVYDVENGLISE